MKDNDLTNSLEYDDEEIPTITISSPPPQFLQNMDTVDDIDEDEAFINELMALHPNDEDIVVEDIEALDYSSGARTTTTIEAIDDIEDNNNNNNEDNDDGVRKIVFWV